MSPDFKNGHICVDFDATLAHYDGWKGHASVGAPIPKMLERVKKWLDEGIDVRIFTARADSPKDVELIQDWCREHLGRILQVTNRKDFSTVEIWDDRAVQVQKNTGVEVVDEIAETSYNNGYDAGYADGMKDQKTKERFE